MHRADFAETEAKGPVMNIQIKTQRTAAAQPLVGKVSLVTGSTSGIGLGIARALAEAGSAVVLNGFGAASEIARTRDQISADCDVKVSYSPADMTKPAAISEMIETTLAEHGRLDVLVTMRAFSMSRRSISFQPRNGTRSCRSICRRRFMRCGRRCRRCARTNSAA